MKQEGNKSLSELLPQEYFWKKEKKLSNFIHQSAANKTNPQKML